MSRCIKSWAVALCSILAGGGLCAGERVGKLQNLIPSIAPGRPLFVEPWSARDKRSPGGDGLGPLHNATSCAACHHQAGAGGGGDRTHNVELLSIAPVRTQNRMQFMDEVVRLHPGFEVGGSKSRSILPNIVLHRFSTEPDYADFRQRILSAGIDSPVDNSAEEQARRGAPVRVLEPVPGIVLNVSERNTPALWGAGVIDSIPDATIQEMARLQKKDHSEIAGRAPLADAGGVGRFGWRGQTAHLRDFVVNACANELGLQTRRSAQAIDPRAPGYRLQGEDMSDADMDELVSFVARLPRPIETQAANFTDADALRQGEQIFERIGCADCHPRQLGSIDGLFSDLLLHDLGSGLEDPVEPTTPGQQQVQSYYGGGSIFVDDRAKRDATLASQWRTPPLWGVSDSAPYLHDGRAATLSEAILEHGGQATASARQFRNLPGKDREKLTAFLATLKAPPQPPKTQLQKVSF